MVQYSVNKVLYHSIHYIPLSGLAVLLMAALDFWCHCDLCEAHQQVPSVVESIKLSCDGEFVPECARDCRTPSFPESFYMSLMYTTLWHI